MQEIDKQDLSTYGINCLMGRLNFAFKDLGSAKEIYRSAVANHAAERIDACAAQMSNCAEYKESVQKSNEYFEQIKLKASPEVIALVGAWDSERSDGELRRDEAFFCAGLRDGIALSMALKEVVEQIIRKGGVV